MQRTLIRIFIAVGGRLMKICPLLTISVGILSDAFRTLMCAVDMMSVTGDTTLNVLSFIPGWGRIQTLCHIPDKLPQKYYTIVPRAIQSL